MKNTGPKKNLVPKMLSTKFFWIKNDPGSEKWCFEKYFVFENFLDPKIFFNQYLA